MADMQNTQQKGTESDPIVVKPEKPFERPEDLLEWEGHDHVIRNKTSVWFLTFIVVGLAALVPLLLLGQWTLSLVVISILFVAGSVNMADPATRVYTITTLGVKFGKKLYNYEDMKSFWVESDDKHSVLYISTYLSFPHILEISIPHEEAGQLIPVIEEELLKYVPYEEDKHSDIMKVLDRGISKFSPYLPQSLISWYNKRFQTS